MLLTPLNGSKWRPLYLSSLCIPNNNVYSANGIPFRKVPWGSLLFYPFQAISWLEQKCVTVLGKIQKSEMFISSHSTNVNHFPVSVLMSIISFSSLRTDVNHLSSSLNTDVNHSRVSHLKSMTLFPQWSYNLFLCGITV